MAIFMGKIMITTDLGVSNFETTPRITHPDAGHRESEEGLDVARRLNDDLEKWLRLEFGDFGGTFSYSICIGKQGVANVPFWRF